MPGLTGLEVTRELAKSPSRPAVVICSVENDPEIVEAARQAGALGYVFKARVAEDLIVAVKSVASGRSFVSPS
jgi:DNA-binding NarL/FixJ family response regulator